MRRSAVQVPLLVGVLVLCVVLWGHSARGQTALEEWATQQISEKTGIDPNLLATLFVSEAEDQFILAFVYINEEVMRSNLRQDLKEAVAPFVGQRAMLTLVVPTRPSDFRPFAISFTQDGMNYLIGRAQIHPVTQDFSSGRVEAQQVSAGVIELPGGIDVGRPFRINYGGSYSTVFSITGVGTAAGERGREQLSDLLLFLVQVLLFFFLFPFLISA